MQQILLLLLVSHVRAYRRQMSLLTKLGVRGHGQHGQHGSYETPRIDCRLRLEACDEDHGAAEGHQGHPRGQHCLLLENLTSLCKVIGNCSFQHVLTNIVGTNSITGCVTLNLYNS